MARLAGVVLAAGSSRRMGTPKAALALAGETFVARVHAALGAAGLEPLVVVTGEHHDAVAAALPVGHGAQLVRNPAPEHGQLSSLKVALRALLAGAPEVTGAVVALVDHPAVAADTVRALARAAAAGGAAILVPTHAGRRGHPVVFQRGVWDELLATPDDAGARAVVRRDPTRVAEILVADPGVLLDVDTPEALAALRAGGVRGR